MSQNWPNMRRFHQQPAQPIEKTFICQDNLYKPLHCQQSSKPAVVTPVTRTNITLILGPPALPPVFKTSPLTCYSRGLWGPRLRGVGESPKLRTCLFPLTHYFRKNCDQNKEIGGWPSKCWKCMFLKLSSLNPFEVPDLFVFLKRGG